MWTEQRARFISFRFVSKEKYPKWIDEFTHAFHNGIAHMTPCSWGPVDGYAVFGFLNGTFLSKLHKAIIVIKQQNIRISEVAKCFPSPSGLRIGIYWLMVEYEFSNPKDKGQFREVLEVLLEVLRFLVKRDIFAYESNIVHEPNEIDGVLRHTPWSKGDAITARELGKLYNSLAALVFALYRDFFPQDSHEIYGPYDASATFGEDAMLLVKHFPKIRPVELWPEISAFNCSDVKIFQVYKHVSFRCELVGMHSMYEGDLMNGLVAYAVSIDGAFVNDPQEIKKRGEYIAEIATKQSLVYEMLSKEELKKKMLEWYCYQFVYFFQLANLDWRPTKSMLEAVKGKAVADRFESTESPTYEEFANSPDFEPYWLKDLYQSL